MKRKIATNAAEACDLAFILYKETLEKIIIEKVI